MRIVYGRVSTRTQNHDAQHEALDAAGCERIFRDTAAASSPAAPICDTMLRLKLVQEEAPTRCL